MKSKTLGAILSYVLIFIFGWCASNLYHASKMEKVLQQNDALTAQLNASEAKRELERSQYEEQIATLRGMVDSSNTVIARLEEEQDVLREAVLARDNTIQELKTAEVQALIERYPALKQFTTALEAQIADLKLSLSKANGIIVEKDTQIQNLSTMYTLKEAELRSMTESRDAEQQLRIQTQKDFAEYRKKPGPASIWTKLLWTGVGLTVSEAAHAVGVLH